MTILDKESFTMIKKFLHIASMTMGMLAVVSCGNSQSDKLTLSIERMDGFPSADTCFAKGVSALYAGVLDEHLVIAGGCNFPNVPVADGGKKVFYPDVYIAPLTEGTTLAWKKVGTLPQASAYGVTISTEKGIVCVGGNTDASSLSDVYRLSLWQDTLHTEYLPSLPVTIDNMAGAMLDGKLYIVGGNVNGVPSSDMYSLDLSASEAGWTKEASVPGLPRVQPVCAAQGGKLYVWGGFATAGEGREASLSVDGYAYDSATKEWKPVATPRDAAGTEVSLGGGVALPCADGILCVGGVNKDIFLQALQGIHSGKPYLTRPVEWYKFNRNLMLYRPATDEWTVLADAEQGARAGAALVGDGDTYYIINGELKPGIRTNEISKIKIEIRK